MGGAELDRPFALELDRIDRDDVARPTSRRTLHSVRCPGLPHPTTATVSPGLHSSCSHCRAPAGDHAAAQQTCHLERDVALERDAAVFDARRCGGRTCRCNTSSAGPRRAVMARCAVGDLQARAHCLAAIAQPRPTVRTTRAMAADRHEVEDHGVADRKSRDARPDCSDDACTLVTTNDRHRPGHVARDEVIVGVAHAGGRSSTPTSWKPGSSSSISSTDHGVPTSQSTAAVVFIDASVHGRPVLVHNVLSGRW